MKHYDIYGASDDLVEIVCDPPEAEALDEINETSGVVTLRLERPDGTGARIHIVLGPSGCWSAGVSPLDEDIAVPDSWRFTLTPGQRPAPAYSTALSITADDDAVLTIEDPA